MHPSPDSGESALRCAVYYGATEVPDTPGARWRPVDELPAHASTRDPAVVVVDASMLGRVEEFRRLPKHVVLVAADRPSEDALADRIHVTLTGVRDPIGRQRVIRVACALAEARSAALRRWREVAATNHELRALMRIGMSLMYEHDLDTLLRQILDAGLRFTSSDGCFLFLAEPGPDGTPGVLRPAMYRVESLPDLPDLTGRVLPIDDTSIIGHAALTGQPVAIADAYAIPSDAGFITNNSFDEQFGYRRRSMLIVPMIDHIGQRVGAFGFINRKINPMARITTKHVADRYVVSYTPLEVRLAEALAAQAAVSIENARLYQRIEAILESFVKASVSAVDQRDPTTSGHSIRVATLATELATAVDRTDGVFREIRFAPKQLRELRYAALLHDFGKIGVPEDILIKARKLPPVLWAQVDARFDLIRRTIEAEFYRTRPGTGDTGNGPPAELMARLEQLERQRRIVAAANEPTVLDEPPNPALIDIASNTFERPDGTVVPYLTREELHFLQLSHGTLDDRERAAAEAHVEQTYRFLANIPWTDDLKNMVAYAYGHHEKLNGTGYPRHLAAADIPIQTRIITIADMFDALTEGDRPYKAAVSTERALDILWGDAAAGALDADLLRVMVDARVYQRILDEHWERL